VCSVLLILTVGLVDAGRAFYQYNAVASAARDADRWASVVGGTCADALPGSSDWCNDLGLSPSTPFWQQAGNAPRQTGGASCPSTPSDANSYAASGYATGPVTTVVGDVVHRHDSNATSRSFQPGSRTPGFELSQLRVCIALPDSWDASKSMYIVKEGDHVAVTVYTVFGLVSPLLGGRQLPLVSSAETEIEWQR
jgi:hypothetical protein